MDEQPKLTVKNCTQCPSFREDKKRCYCAAAMIVLDKKEYYNDAIPLWCPMTG